jgi:hypothetical protein
MIVDPAYEAEQEERKQNTIKVIEEEARRRKVNLEITKSIYWINDLRSSMSCLSQ